MGTHSRPHCRHGAHLRPVLNSHWLRGSSCVAPALGDTGMPTSTGRIRVTSWQVGVGGGGHRQLNKAAVV